VDLKIFHMAKDCVGCNCVLWNCNGYTLTYICVTALYLGVSTSMYQNSLSLAVWSRLEVIPINCIGNIVAIMLDPRTLLFVSSTCGTVFQRIVWIFLPLRHSNEQSNRLILRHFYLVRLRFNGLLLVPLCGLLINIHIVCILFSHTAVSFIRNIVCEN